MTQVRFCCFFRCWRKGSGESVSGFFTIAFTVKVSLSTLDLPISGLLRMHTVIHRYVHSVRLG